MLALEDGGSRIGMIWTEFVARGGDALLVRLVGRVWGLNWMAFLQHPFIWTWA
jgi:hypothetical protein